MTDIWFNVFRESSTIEVADAFNVIGTCGLSIKSTVVSDSFERLELKFQAYETLVSHRWNYSFTPMKLWFQAMEGCGLVLVDNFVCYNWISLLNIL